MKKSIMYSILILLMVSFLALCINVQSNKLNSKINKGLTEFEDKYNLLAAIECYCHKSRTVAAECATCYPATETCVAGWVDSNCSSCYYGSPSSCVGGYDNGACNAFGAELYNSGNGGSNTVHASLTNTSSQSGANEGNGKAILTYIGG